VRLLDYINESSYELDNFNDLIHKDCRPYLSLIGNNNPIMRGMRTADRLGIKDVRKDRRPLGMDKEDANVLNDWLQRKGHCRRDKSVLCSYDSETADNFGFVHYIFPIGSFRYSWIEARDINGSYNPTGWHGNTVEAWIADQKKESNIDDRLILSRLRMPFEHYFHTDEGYSEMMTKRYECWIECDKYYNAMIDIYSWEGGRLVRDEE